MSPASLSYGPLCQTLLEAAPLNVLGPGEPDTAQRERLSALTDDALFGQPATDASLAACCRAALWLRFNFLHESHEISQQIDTPTGSYWHALMHRREQDYDNAKYWFRRVGAHPIYPELARATQQMSPVTTDARLNFFQRPKWDPLGFVDLCQQLANEESEANLVARRAAAAEWQHLFDFCFRGAVEGT